MWLSPIYTYVFVFVRYESFSLEALQQLDSSEHPYRCLQVSGCALSDSLGGLSPSGVCHKDTTLAPVSMHPGSKTPCLGQGTQDMNAAGPSGHS